MLFKNSEFIVSKTSFLPLVVCVRGRAFEFGTPYGVGFGIL